MCIGVVGSLEFNVPFQRRYGYIRDECIGVHLVSVNWLSWLSQDLVLRRGLCTVFCVRIMFVRPASGIIHRPSSFLHQLSD